jgi:hypothetical protein
MDSAVNGGGWMMALKATTGTTFQFSSAHWTTATTLNPTDTTRNNADAKFNTFNYFQSKDILALWPDIPNTYGGSTTGGSLNLPTWGCWCWLKANYNAGTLQTLMSYFGTASNVSFATPTTTAIRFPEQGTAFTVEYYMNTNASTIASGNSFYGINFTSFATRNVRWGLAYNNESDWGSNDCGSGIGNSSATNNYSAGDEGAWIAANPISGVVGINRSARVEMYVR